MVTFDKNKLSELLKSLKDFPQLKEVKALKSRLEKEKVKITPKPVVKPTPTKAEVTAVNLKRSKALKKHFGYLRLIRDNFPNLKFAEIRKQFSKKRRGEESDIPDVIWQNPSP